MRVIEPSYKIVSCPDGEECLAKLEYIGRKAYKSEDKIDPGQRCACRGESSCAMCDGSGWLAYPSSHKLLRAILKTSRREDLKKEAANYLGKCDRNHLSPSAAANYVVDLVMNSLRDDPPHESVIEHEIITVLFTSNRGFTHELVRHRLCAFTQESTRYCNYSKGKFGSEITVSPKRTAEDILDAIYEWCLGVDEAQDHYMSLIAKGVKPQIARDLLPQVLKADIVITTNLREWRHIFRLRCSPRAHPDMRRLMVPLHEELRRRIPIIFDEL